MKKINKNHWDKFYKKFKFDKESKFANFVYKKLLKLKFKPKILDVGCGNGRDTIFFIKKNIDVTGIDLSNVIYSNKKNFTNKFIRKNICAKNFNLKKKFNIIYARFFIHAINNLDFKNLMINLNKITSKKTLFFFEFRTTRDPLMKKGIRLSKYERYNGHYRRFINIKEFKKELNTMGYEIIFIKSSFNFAIFHKQKPNICRAIFRKK